jgi:hypothetical protein
VNQTGVCFVGLLCQPSRAHGPFHAQIQSLLINLVQIIAKQPFFDNIILYSRGRVAAALHSISRARGRRVAQTNLEQPILLAN